MLASLNIIKPKPSRSLRQHREYDSHEFVIALTDQKAGLRAFIAIHNRNLGMAHGGTRMKAYAAEDDALADVLNLSKAMSYKSALASLAYGGAKGVIMVTGQETQTEREAILQAYASKVEALRGLFHTGTDVGLTDEDIRRMAKICHYMLGVGDSTDRQGFSTSKAAALGVYYAIKEAADFRYGRDDLNGKTLGIKGVGKLGGELARLLYHDGASLVVADLDQNKLADLKAELPNITIVPVTEISRLQMHIYAPCALGDEFTPSNIKYLNCDVIAGGANNQLANEKVGDMLHQKEVLYVPDYIANAGGLIFVSDELEADGFRLERVQERLKNIRQTLRLIFAKTKQEDIPTHRVANLIAQERISKG